jgi:hypothetical protein
MGSVEVKVDDFYRDIQKERKNQLFLLLLGLVMIIGSLIVVSITKKDW